MEIERTENIFYLNLKHVHKYGCAKFQPNPLFSSQQTATKSVAEEKKKEQQKKRQKKKNVDKPIGDPVGGRDAPMKFWTDLELHFNTIIYSSPSLIRPLTVFVKKLATLVAFGEVNILIVIAEKIVALLEGGLCWEQ